MERTALQRAGLADVPMSVLKPHFGHTMGAAGVLETILCAEMASNSQCTMHNAQLIKMLSGFGGVNAAIRIEK